MNLKSRQASELGALFQKAGIEVCQLSSFESQLHAKVHATPDLSISSYLSAEFLNHCLGAISCHIQRRLQNL
jgi:hypothetical protein